jgi:hypothetical protein
VGSFFNDSDVKIDGSIVLGASTIIGEFDVVRQLTHNVFPPRVTLFSVEKGKPMTAYFSVSFALTVGARLI